MWLTMKFSISLVLLCLNLGESTFFYGPSFIRPNKNYTMMISNIMVKNNDDFMLDVRIEGKGSDGFLLNLSRTVHVNSDTNRIITFNVPSDIHDGNYSIVIEGNGNYEKYQLEYRGYYLNGLIQLSQPVITPGNKLMFRVIVVDDDLKPPLSHKTNTSVYVQDPHGEVIQQWTNVSIYSGMFENQILISSIPVLGTYNILAEANGNRLVSKTFEVRDYDLNSIYLNIFPTFVPLVEHQALNLTVEVKNHLGKLLTGNFTVACYFYGENIVMTQTWDVNGVRQVYLPFTKNLNLKTRIDNRAVKLRVTFTQQYTNRTTTKAEFIRIHNYKYDVRPDVRRVTYFPGSLFKTTLKVAHRNYEPAKNVTLRVGIEDAKGLNEQNYTSDKNGQIKISMTTNTSTKLKYLRVYDGKNIVLEEQLHETGGSKVFLNVVRLTRVKFNRMMRFMVTCSHGMDILMYFIRSKGRIVDIGVFRPNQRTRYVFQFLVSKELIPHSTIVLFASANGTTTQHFIFVNVRDLDNPVMIKKQNPEEDISEDGVDPGDEIELSIRGRPGAFVALAAYDYQLMQYSEDHDFFLDDVRDLFFKIDTFDFDIIATIGDTGSLFDDINIHDVAHAMRGIYPDAPRFGMPQPYRTDFWESWLWQNFTIPSSGRIQHVQRVPHTATSWYITGFSIHPEYGLGIVKYPITFSTFKIFYINHHLPDSIKRGETVTLYFTVFSRLDEEFEATVTMFNAKNQTQFIDRPTGAARETKMLMVPPKSDAAVSFRVKALKLGEMEIRVNASIMKGVVSDSIKKILKVLPKDITIQRSKRTPFRLEASTTKSFIIFLSIDERAVDSSIYIGGTVYPNQKRSKDVPNNYNVSLHYGDKIILFHVNSESKENITIESIPAHIRSLTMIVTGSGLGLLEINWQYRLNLMHFKPRFNLNITNQATTSVWMRELNICCSFIPKNGDNHSNGTVVEVGIPTGYAMDQHNVLETATTNPIDRVEIRHDGTTMLLHFNKMDNEATCFSVFAYRRYRLPQRRPSYLMVQDSYRPKFNAIMLFDLY